eukprot:TRINITY_DN861_c0_g1_i2.p1 TRINITY_DN861_c0_g1~~TRINITY_DN861_c0_g1_i2.p1  ORF type:complete len:254 (+),score=42.79 TRINITY_DN861_c0_g1_i2:31-792(+)
MASALQDKVAIVTGASSGIGAATAELLAKSGAKVVLLARRENLLQLLKEKLLKELPEAQILLEVLDVTDQKGFQQVAERTIKQWGRIDILINNAGCIHLSLLKNLLVDEWSHMVDVNVKGVLNGVAAVLPFMRQQKSGHIINISSDADKKVWPGSSIYSGTKAFVTLFSEGLKMELMSDKLPIRVTTISGGASQLDDAERHMTDKDALEAHRKFRDFEILKSSDIANVILVALTSDPRVNLNYIVVRPVEQIS